MLSRHPLHVLVGAAVTLFVPGGGAAQTTPPAEHSLVPGASAWAARSRPRLAVPGWLEVPAAEEGFATSLSLQERQSRASNAILIGVGVSGLVAGSLIGGDAGAVITVGGGIAALIGIYRAFQ